MKNKAFTLIEKYAKVLAEMEGYDQKATKIIINIDDRIFETEDGCDFHNLTSKDVIVASGTSGSLYPVEHKLVKSQKDIGAIVLSRTPYCKRCETLRQPITAAIDDMAQIVGHTVQCVPYDEKSIGKALRSATGCLIKDHYTLTTGRNLYEAVVALTVLEKSAEINTKAKVLGGVKPLPRWEAVLMRQVYKRKYSKAEQEVKAEEGR